MEGLFSPSNLTTELLAAESLVSPSEGHWVSLHRNLTSPEERQLTDYIGIVDSESNHSIHTEEIMNSGLDSMQRKSSSSGLHADEKQSNQPFSVYTRESWRAEGSDDDLHEPDSLEELCDNADENAKDEANRHHKIENHIVPNEFRQYPKEKTKTRVLESKQLNVWYQKVWAPDSLKIALKVEPLDPAIIANNFHIEHCQGDVEVTI